ncbi:MAG: hypothetical protein A3B14_00205 [Candidatus Zambryskibacteria bacterium RIFCSPLOWO2_01_FULL_45_21]|uniref:Uncharacterized protein n=1 Tax=Candidatus Zambryskibacteria bacterium RIFCSPLOWO2_01_FULL_45_21 TaxID=1802761 RepID=A0A1G2U2P7_9BACT|nr:MAG: hypothetical protein A3B14_00205 [Candidatus Zambryskibacteria bacterium RIFCSPLOWO2_01_FULL_45_21]
MAEERKGLLGRLGGSRIADLLFEKPDDAGATGKSKKASRPGPELSEAKQRLAAMDVALVETGEGKVDKVTYDSLYEDVVLSQPTPFTSFLEQVETLQGVIPDERTLFAAAAKTCKQTEGAILLAISQHLAVLDRERKEVATEASRQTSQAVGTREARRGEINSKVSEIDEEIGRLKEQQRRLREEFEKLGEEIKTQSAAIENGCKVFEAAATALQHDLEEKKGKIVLYLKGA